MNQYPTVFVSFRQVDGLNFAGAYDMLTWVISELDKKHLYLLDSDKIDNTDKDIAKQLVRGDASLKDTKGSLLLLTRMMQQHYGKPVILLIDEYDVPVAKANNNGYDNEMLDVMKGLIEKISTMLSLRIFSPVPDIWWIPTKSMGKAEVILSFMIPSMPALQSLKQSTQRYWKIWRASVIRPYSRLMIVCTRRNMGMTTIKFFATVFLSLRNAAW